MRRASEACTTRSQSKMRIVPGCECAGVGPIISTAMIAAIGTDDAFQKGRDFAAWLGLVPRQLSTGSRSILGRISRGLNRYLGTLFIQGARAVLLRRQTWARHGFGAWLEAASKRLHSECTGSCLGPKTRAHGLEHARKRPRLRRTFHGHPA